MAAAGNIPRPKVESDFEVWPEVQSHVFSLSLVLTIFLVWVCNLIGYEEREQGSRDIMTLFYCNGDEIHTHAQIM